MRVIGFQVKARKVRGTITEDEVERIYLSLEDNFMITSIDMGIDLEEGIDMLIGVRCTELSDGPEEQTRAATEILRDAVKKALMAADGSDVFRAEKELAVAF